MDTNTALKNYRLNQWEALIRERTQSGLTVRQFCLERNLTRDSYYYWQRKVRDYLVENAGDAPQFVELTENLSRTETLPKTLSGMGDAFPAQAAIRIGNALIEINENTPGPLLAAAVEVLLNAQ